VIQSDETLYSLAVGIVQNSTHHTLLSKQSGKMRQSPGTEM
jgi:hypothetical protein